MPLLRPTPRLKGDAMDLDMDTTKDALVVAKNGAAAIDAVVGTLQRLQSLFQSSKPAPVQEVRAALADLSEKVMKAREENVVLREQAIELRHQIIEMKRREDKFAGYELFETSLGAVVLRSGNGVKPVHYLCPGCHDAGVKTILQGDGDARQCTATPSHGWFQFQPSQPIRRNRDEFY